MLRPQHRLGADTDSGQLCSEILTSYRLKEPENNSCMRASTAFPPQSGGTRACGLVRIFHWRQFWVCPARRRTGQFQWPPADNSLYSLSRESCSRLCLPAPLRPDRAPGAHWDTRHSAVLASGFLGTPGWLDRCHLSRSMIRGPAVRERLFTSHSEDCDFYQRLAF